ncbi:cyclase family protein [Dactylosporangium sp. CA-233914]|uniref:cyclase family protein n=1 Tax=Dactylosporangium sp. CA-233914 TaxID=3239934 RepID=UPI003D8ECBAC
MTAVNALSDLARLLAGVRVVDLSLTLAEDLPGAWPTHMPFQAKPWSWFHDRPDDLLPLDSGCGSYFTRWLVIDEHTGTHFDAASHFLPPDASSGFRPETAEQVDLSKFVGPAAVIRVSMDDLPQVPGESPTITPEIVEAWERRNGRIAAGTVVLFSSQWDQRYTRATRAQYTHDVVITKTTAGWPAPSAETMDALHTRGVRCVGIDAPSMGAAHDGEPVHVCGLGKGIVFVEGLANLDQLPEAGAFFVFMPLKLRGGSGAPGRAIAFVSNDSPKS